MSDVDPATKHEEMMDKILSGRKLESPDEVTRQYREVLSWLLIAQSVNELAGGYGLLSWVKNAPDISAKVHLSHIATDEIRHAKLIFDLLEALGVNSAKYYHNYFDYAESFILRPIKSWPDLIAYNLLIDSAADEWLRDFADCSWGPWNRAMRQIQADEVMHLAHGDRWIERLAQRPEQKEAVQRALDAWFPLVNVMFGEPGAQRNQTALLYRLQLRKNEDVRKAWCDRIEERVSKHGYTLPPGDKWVYAKRNVDIYRAARRLSGRVLRRLKRR